MNKKIISIIVGVAVIAGGSFYAGLKYGQGGGTSGEQRQARNNGGSGGRTRGAGFVNGDILNKDDKSITVQNRGGSGGSQIVFYSGSTVVLKSVQGTAADLTAGEQVTIIGTPNSDGSVTAQSIQIRPVQQNQPAGSGTAGS